MLLISNGKANTWRYNVSRWIYPARFCFFLSHFRFTFHNFGHIALFPSPSPPSPPPSLFLPLIEIYKYKFLHQRDTAAAALYSLYWMPIPTENPLFLARFPLRTSFHSHPIGTFLSREAFDDVTRDNATRCKRSLKLRSHGSIQDKTRLHIRKLLHIFILRRGRIDGERRRRSLRARISISSLYAILYRDPRYTFLSSPGLLSSGFGH